MHPIELKLKNITAGLKKEGSPEIFIRNSLKEYLQDVTLSIIYNDSNLKDLIFYGGSCLRKIYGLNRLSEDLDFESVEKIDVEFVAKKIYAWFKKDKFVGVEVKTQVGENINRVVIKFKVLHDLGLSPREDEKLHIKVEINDSPTGVYPTVLSPYHNGKYSMLVKHYDLETLMAGKIVACINRSYVKRVAGGGGGGAAGSAGDPERISFKGRDFYDLIWYMQKGVKPNVSKFKDCGLAEKEAFNLLDEKVGKIFPRDLLVDLESLFPEKNYIKDWCENFGDFYSRYRRV